MKDALDFDQNFNQRRTNMFDRFLVHLSIILSLISSSLVISGFLYIDLFVQPGVIHLASFNVSGINYTENEYFPHPYKLNQRINVSRVDTHETCVSKYGHYLVIEFNIADTIIVFILMGTIAIGVLSLNTI